MALLNEEIINSSINTCDFSVSDPIDSTGWRISLAVLQLLLSLFHLFTVLYLSLVLKKRAWDSPAKRFGHFFNLYFALTFLFFAIINFSISSIYSYSLAIIIVQYPIIIAFLNFAALLVALSLQLVAPFLPERVKKQYAGIHRPCCVKFTEVIIHVFFLLLTILSATLSWVFCNLCACIDYSPKLVFIVVCFSNIVLFLSFGILVFTYIKFFKNPNINKSIKYVILKLVFIIIICILFILSIFILPNNLIFWFLYLFFNFVLTLSVVSLNSPLHIWCYNCHSRESSSHVQPLLPVNDTDRQQTNPISVWDHRNVPSYTATNLPFEMSDCRSDYKYKLSI